MLEGYGGVEWILEDGIGDLVLMNRLRILFWDVDLVEDWGRRESSDFYGHVLVIPLVIPLQLSF